MALFAGLAALLSALLLRRRVGPCRADLAEPADGSVLAQSPKTVQLHFGESRRAGRGQPDRCRRQDARRRLRAVGQSVVIALPDDLPQGTQVVSYRVVSQDGHPVADR